MRRLSLDEVGEVARLAARRRLGSLGQGAASHEVGAVLGLPTADVERLLEEIRQRAPGASGPGGPSSARGAALGLVGVLAFLLMIAIGVFATGFASKRAPSPKAAVQAPAVEEAPRPVPSIPIVATPSPSVGAVASEAPEALAGEEPFGAGRVQPEVRVKSDETEMGRAARWARAYAAASERRSDAPIVNGR